MRRLAIILLLWSLSAQAQNVFDAYKADVNTYLGYYARPVFESMILHGADGWVHRAKPLKTFHVALDVNLNYSFIPPKFQSFAFIPSEYQHMSIQDSLGHSVGTVTGMPTVFGGDTDYYIDIKVPASAPGTYYELKFRAPPGFRAELDSLVEGLGVGMPGAAVQLRVGLPLNSEVAIRYFPKKNFGNITPDVFGIGIKHDIGQYLGLKSVFRLLAYGAYSHSRIRVARDSIAWTAVYRLNTYTLGAVASGEFKFVSVYGGMAVIRGDSGLRILGHKTFDYDITDGSGHVIGHQSETLTDPIDLRFGIYDVKGFAGIQLNLAILHIFAQYNIQKYPGWHAGISISI